MTNLFDEKDVDENIILKDYMTFDKVEFCAKIRFHAKIMCVA